MLKGAVHIHSDYSDGEFTLRQLREIYVASGCVFACITDHAESFDEPKAEKYRRECVELSDDQFCFVPGMEFECEQRMHILGFGVTALAGTQDPELVIRHIDQQGGISVIAHPKDSAFPWIESFVLLPHGIETWNSKYDGRYAPRPSTFQLLNRLQRRNPGLLAFYGQDLHWKRQYRGLLNLVGAENVRPDEILAALSRGDFTGIKDNHVLPSHGHLNQPLLEEFARVNRASNRFRKIVTATKGMIRHLGLDVPPSVKSKLRRFF